MCNKNKIKLYRIASSWIKKALIFGMKYTKNYFFFFLFWSLFLLFFLLFVRLDFLTSVASAPVSEIAQFSTYVPWIEYSSIIIWIRNAMNMLWYIQIQFFFTFFDLPNSEFVRNYAAVLLLAFVFSDIRSLFVVHSCHNKQKLNFHPKKYI